MKKSLEEEKSETKYCPIKDGYCNENCMFWFEGDCLVLGSLTTLTIGFDDIVKQLKEINKNLAKIDGIRFVRR